MQRASYHCSKHIHWIRVLCQSVFPNDPTVCISHYTGVSLATVTVSPMQFNTLLNRSVVSSSDVTNDKGIVCATALNQADIGEWLFPDGTAVVGSGFTVDPLYVLFRTSQVDLHGRRNPPVSLEGIYTCNIPNENSVMQVLYIGIYSSPGTSPGN